MAIFYDTKEWSPLTIFMLMILVLTCLTAWLYSWIKPRRLRGPKITRTYPYLTPILKSTIPFLLNSGELFKRVF